MVPREVTIYFFALVRPVVTTVELAVASPSVRLKVRPLRIVSEFTSVVAKPNSFASVLFNTLILCPLITPDGAEILN